MSCQDRPCIRCGRPTRPRLEELDVLEDGARAINGPLCRPCIGELKEWLRPKPVPTRPVNELIIPVRVEIGDRERAKLAALKTLLEG